MFRKIFVGAVVFFLIWGFKQVKGQQCMQDANKVDVVIKPRIVFNPKHASFQYNYTLYSKPDSIQNVQSFDVEVPNFPALPYKIGGWDFSFVTPSVGGGRHSMAPANDAAWAADRESDDIFPGETRKGLFLKSLGLPGIVRSWSQGDVPFPPSVPDVNPALTAKCPDQGYSPQMNEIQKTVGSDLFPVNITNLQLVERLIHLKEQAFQLGWITNKGVANSLDKKLEEVKKKIKEGHLQTAGNILRSFVLDLEAQHQKEEPENEEGQKHEQEKEEEQSHKHVTDNTYYLLKPNAEFILLKLKEQEEQNQKEDEK